MRDFRSNIKPQALWWWPSKNKEGNTLLTASTHIYSAKVGELLEPVGICWLNLPSYVRFEVYAGVLTPVHQVGFLKWYRQAGWSYHCRNYTYSPRFLSLCMSLVILWLIRVIADSKSSDFLIMRDFARLLWNFVAFANSGIV